MALFGNNNEKDAQDLKALQEKQTKTQAKPQSSYETTQNDTAAFDQGLGSADQPVFNDYSEPQKPMDFPQMDQPIAPVTKPMPQTPPADTYTAMAPQVPEMNQTTNAQSGYPWKQTQRNLVGLQQQESQLKDQLKQELLDQRSFLKHDLRHQKTALLNSATKLGDPAQQIQTQIDEVNQGLVQWFGTKKIANHVFFNKKRRYYLLTDTLSTKDDFVQKGVLGQLKRLFDGMEMSLGHISTDYNDRLGSVAQQLRQQGLFAKNAHLLNKYQDLQEYNKHLERRNVEVPITGSMTTVHDAESHGDKVYDANQQLIMAIYYQNDKQVHVIEHYRENTMISRDIFDHNGAISATQYFDQVNSSRIIRENFYRTDGSLVLIKSYQDNEPYIQLLSRSNVLMAIFNSELELTLWWLENQIFDSETTILIPVSSALYQPLVTSKELNVELMPILENYEEHAEITDQLMNEKSSIDSLLVSQKEAKTFIENNTQHDIDISVLPRVDTESGMGSIKQATGNNDTNLG